MISKLEGGEGEDLPTPTSKEAVDVLHKTEDVLHQGGYLPPKEERPAHKDEDIANEEEEVAGVGDHADRD